MRANEKTLYQKGAYGTKVWQIWSEDRVIYIKANSQVYTENVAKGLGGKSLQQQVAMRVDARVRNKLDSGFKEDITDIAKSNLNQLGLPLPMLAKPYKDVKNTVDAHSCFYQSKLNGHRCIITKQNGELLAYSRRGRWVHVINHILTELTDLPEGYFLDGELYKHGIALQTIASLVKRDYPLAETRTIEYHVYDAFRLDKPKAKFHQRMAFVDNLINGRNKIFVKAVPTRLVEDTNMSIIEILERNLAAGFEGVILRPKDGVYGMGKRPVDLIKVKKFMDAEFVCLDIIPSREGWGILILQAHNGLEFKCTAPGTVPDKINTLKHKELYIGRTVTCEFAEYTNKGIPFHNTALGWRRDI